MRKEFNPEISILKFNINDIITASGEPTEPTLNGNDDGSAEGLEPTILK